ncbi:uncharacterized protein BDZ99DRAFT_576967 [Mytilinidion resinicola]|uniref:Uncharacterized protein n=1 Tax=Mytilinidion resinicola TaxID=574789 RepID=A0A6A6Y3A5_9PEZI|nr:uncharacterized protein BDZ99DRAFT_576967 [Mytilinidion resinicola]KAF2802267.1 hypothetical protein BDZ99DRAFT_576967 [Mytilinidion resinicola]
MDTLTRDQIEERVKEPAEEQYASRECNLPSPMNGSLGIERGQARNPRLREEGSSWKPKKNHDELTLSTKNLIDSRIGNAQRHWGISALADAFPERVRPLMRVDRRNHKLKRPFCVENDPKRWSHEVLSLVEELAECSKDDLETALKCLEEETKNKFTHSYKCKDSGLCGLDPSDLRETIHHYKWTKPHKAANWTRIRGKRNEDAEPDSASGSNNWFGAPKQEPGIKCDPDGQQQRNDDSHESSTESYCGHDFDYMLGLHFTDEDNQSTSKHGTINAADTVGTQVASGDVNTATVDTHDTEKDTVTTGTDESAARPIVTTETFETNELSSTSQLASTHQPLTVDQRNSIDPPNPDTPPAPLDSGSPIAEASTSSSPNDFPSIAPSPEQHAQSPNLKTEPETTTEQGPHNSADPEIKIEEGVNPLKRAHSVDASEESDNDDLKQMELKAVSLEAKEARMMWELANNKAAKLKKQQREIERQKRMEEERRAKRARVEGPIVIDLCDLD